MNKSTNQQVRYVLITAAHNEESFIRKTIESVISQTILPKRWVIVSDGSTDKTDEIIKEYLANHPWMELVRMPERKDRNFASKAICFEVGRQKVKGINYDIIGNLDADISFEPDYLEFLLKKFEEYKNLGVAGTPFLEDGYSSISDSFEGGKHVAGGCQLFRKECFEEIGGYVPNKEGGIDWIAVTTARMKGWQTISFKEKVFYHHRRLGTGNSKKLEALFNYGKKDYYLGNHPLWEIFRFIYRLTKKPYIIGALILYMGYLWAWIIGMKRPISPELMHFHRKEEMEKLRRILLSIIRLRKFNKYEVE